MVEVDKLDWCDGGGVRGGIQDDSDGDAEEMFREHDGEVGRGH